MQQRSDDRDPRPGAANAPEAGDGRAAEAAFRFDFGSIDQGKNLYSLINFDDLIGRIIVRLGIRSICEIGVEFGAFAAWLAKGAKANNIRYVGIDPAPRIRAALPREQADSVVTARSLDFLRANPEVGFDLYLVDGDHNYFTVRHELEEIFSSRRPGLAVALVHDVLWPCGRRDFYYDRESIPPEFRHPDSIDGRIMPGERGLTAYGLESLGKFTIARVEGGLRNGILTAVEDVVAVGPSRRYFVVPYCYGLAVVWDEARLAPAQRAALQEITAEIARIAALLERLERNRVDLFASLVAAQQRIAEFETGALRAPVATGAAGGGTLAPHVFSRYELLQTIAAASPADPYDSEGPLVRALELGRALAHRGLARRRPRTVRRLADMLRFVDDGIDLVSFDFFDTLVERRVAPPEAVKARTAAFAAIAFRQAGHPITAAHFSKVREFEEIRLRAFDRNHAAGDHECHIEELMAAVVRRIAGVEHAALADLLVAYECEIETTVIRAKPGAVEVLQAVKAAGKKVVVASDMYLGVAHIRRIAEENGLAPWIDAFYVSSEHKRAKHTGRLFDRILEEMELPAERVLHVGDSIVPDYDMPASRGIRAVHLFEPDAIAARRSLAGAIRAFNSRAGKITRADARLLAQLGLRPFDGAPEGALRAVGSAFLIFAVRALRDLLALNVDRVYFLAREGIFLEQLFTAVAGASAVWRFVPRRPTFHLVRVSRSSLVAAHFTSFDDARTLIDLTLFRHRVFDIGKFLSTWGLDLADFSPQVADSLRENLQLSDQTAFARLLTETPLGAEVQRLLSGARDRAIGYLRQEEFFAPGRVAVVDIGWGGTIQLLLTKLAQRARAPVEIVGLYFGTDKRISELDAEVPASVALPGYLIDHGRNPHAVAELRLAFPVIETLAGDDRVASAAGYAVADDRYVAVDAPHEESAATVVVQQQFQAAVLAAAPDFAVACETSTLSLDRISLFFQRRLWRYLTRPRRRDIAALRAAEFAYDWGDSMKRPMIVARSWGHWRDPRRAIQSAIRSAWPQASVRQLGFPLASFVFNTLAGTVERYPGLRARLVAIYRRVRS